VHSLTWVHTPPPHSRDATGTPSRTPRQVHPTPEQPRRRDWANSSTRRHLFPSHSEAEPMTEAVWERQHPPTRPHHRPQRTLQPTVDADERHRFPQRDKSPQTAERCALGASIGRYVTTTTPPLRLPFVPTRFGRVRATTRCPRGPLGRAGDAGTARRHRPAPVRPRTNPPKTGSHPRYIPPLTLPTRLQSGDSTRLWTGEGGV
jgi:hypothetical protein